MSWKYPRVRHSDGLPTEDPAWLAQAQRIAKVPRDRFVASLKGLPRAEVEKRLRLRFRYDVEWFLRYFWPEAYSAPFNTFQTWFINRESLFWQDRARKYTDNILHATAAPRGNAKTTLSSGKAVHDAVYGLEGYVVIVSANLKKGAVPIMKNICDMAQEPRLQALYGKVVVKRNEEDRIVTVAGQTPMGLAARSFTTQIRGTKIGNQRPTKIVVDDGEDPLRVKNPDNRKADEDFLQGDILKAGPNNGGLLVDWVGTVLHRDAILPGLVRKPGWRGRIWRAIEQWSTDEESLALWERCRQVWADLANEDREQDARRFYEANKEAMDRGWKVMDPTTWPLFRLQVAIWSEGLESFLRERQNEANLAQYSFFDVDKFRWFDLKKEPDGRRYVAIQSPRYGEIRSYVDQMTLVGYLDPVPGQDLGSLSDGAGAGDYAAFAVVGKDRYGYAYVLEVWMARARDSDQINKVWELAEKWKVRTVGIETNNFARLITRDFQRSQQERASKGLYYEVDFISDHVQTKKEDRIAALQPVAMEHGWLRFNSEMADKENEVRKQFEDFPNGSHDDGPDAISSAFRLLGGTPEVAPSHRRVVRRG